MTEARLQAEDVVHRFGDEAGVHGISLTVVRGQIHAIVGLNGAGKTTLMRLFLGMLRPQVGTALVYDTPVADAGPRVWRHVGHLVDAPFAYPELRTYENLLVAARLRGISRDRAAAAADRIADELNLTQYTHRRARILSQGNRQRLGIAAALIHGPDTVILDEPTNGLDPAGVIALREALRSRADEGAAIFVSSHHLDEVARVADTITVINRGRVVGSLDPSGVDLEREFFRLVHADDQAHRR